ncbi:hypothetical protein [Hymenobacter rigui]|uniref:DUF4168 domain-containing protein n=1 Tax=Hymenobacter rigui TaxID=334424 RepID=A0A428KWZ9_9BACT|nr:hypothetical protein [Hymenobacter rigui]RSK51343.1 hypothetical protein EI291_03255 [Hymenobacter rigui]
MNNLYSWLLAAFCLFSFTQLHAQEASPAFKSEATAATRQLAALISLDDARQLPVRRFTQIRLTQEAEARQLYANDADMLGKKLADIGQEYTRQLEQVLTATQYQRFLAAAPGMLPASVAAVAAPQPAAQPAASVAPPQPAVPAIVSKSQPSRPTARPTAPRSTPAKAAARR